VLGFVGDEWTGIACGEGRGALLVRDPWVGYDDTKKTLSRQRTKQISSKPISTEVTVSTSKTSAPGSNLEQKTLETKK
jgi:hypothetical protein